ncbi:hypothetical protein PR202_ga28829 [Eleusine coracana subsp. coracana]|uniref:Uncharacterized protein n=1 Tax=Eleusine coracana subsp. coracana TaxID=191504 RepID=A0AAV5DJK8_ELECO|nr:hypothetical protein PR202_ga28829 [Eleusine coracana subsp. coracana]
MVHTRGGSAPSARAEASTMKRECPDKSGATRVGKLFFETSFVLRRPVCLIVNSCPEYWEQRLQSEPVKRVRLAKEHWETQCRAFLGI